MQHGEDWCSLVQLGVICADWCSLLHVGVVWCRLVQCGADWCSSMNVGLLHVGADWCNMVQFGGQQYTLQHGSQYKSCYFAEKSKCHKISPSNAFPLKFRVQDKFGVRR